MPKRVDGARREEREGEREDAVFWKAEIIPYFCDVAVFLGADTRPFLPPDYDLLSSQPR